MNASIYTYFNLCFYVSLLLLTEASFLLFQLMGAGVFKDSDSKTRMDCLLYSPV